jgi:hypothetical protein
MPRPVKLAAAALGVAALGGCGSSGPTISADRMSKLVVQPGDLGPAFSPFYDGKQLSADQTGARHDPARFGRRGGWIVRYRRAGSPRTKGPLIVASRVDLFGDAGGAKKDFSLYATDLRHIAGTKVAAPTVGSESAVYTNLQGSARIGVRSYTIAWREHNATAELQLDGFERGFVLAQALALARKQDLRLRRAAR